MTLPHLLPSWACVVVVTLASAACATEARAPSIQRSTPARLPVAVTVTSASVHTVSESIEVVGLLAPKFTADVKSEVSGVVTGVFVTEWTAVHVGEPLARLDTSETEAALEGLKAVTAQAAVAETRARREHDRAGELLRYGLITPQAAADARSALEAAEAGAAAARAQVRTAEARLAKYFIKAPMTGVIALRRVNVGDRVENMGGGDPMFRIVDNRLLELTVAVPSSRAGSVHVGQPLEFVTDALPDRRFSGRVMFINPGIDEVSRSARVVGEVPNRDGVLKGGLFARGRIQTAQREDVVLVPREALLNWNVGARTADLFVVAGDCAERRSVRTGAVAPEGVEIVEGVAPGDSIVTRGSFALHAGDRVTVGIQADADRR